MIKTLKMAKNLTKFTIKTNNLIIKENNRKTTIKLKTKL